MHQLVLDVREGATAAALLGALVELGASLESIEAAVATLGSGDVRLQVHATATGSAVRVHAPQDTRFHPTWEALRPRVELLALDDSIVGRAVQVLDALFDARAEVHGVKPAAVEIEPLSGTEDLALAVALAAAVVSLDVTHPITATAVGHGRGTMHTIEGDVQLPGPVVAELLDGLPTVVHDHAAELTDPMGAAFLVALADLSTRELPEGAEARGHGRLPHDLPLTALQFSDASGTGPEPR